MEGFFYFCGKLKTIRLSWYAYLQPDMKTATLLGDKKLEKRSNIFIEILLDQSPITIVGGGGEDSLEQMLHSIPTANIFYMLKYDHGAISEAIREYQNVSNTPIKL